MILLVILCESGASAKDYDHDQEHEQETLLTLRLEHWD